MELITALYFHFHTPYGFREINFSKTLWGDTTLRNKGAVSYTVQIPLSLTRVQLQLASIIYQPETIGCWSLYIKARHTPFLT